MVKLANYTAFEGRAWDTGPLRNALAYQGTVAPHNGQPLSEALLLGIGGGVIAGYFTFEYTGHDPYLHFLTRNTLEPGERIRERLGLQMQQKQTDKPDIALNNLLAALEAGKAPLVWVDASSMAYNNLPPDQPMMLPVIVFGYDEAADRVDIADRPRVAVHSSMGELAQARARIGKDKQRVQTVTLPSLEVLPAAVEAGMRQCTALLLDEPPLKPMAGKFGLAAYQRWAAALADTRSKNGWAKLFAPGGRFYSGLRSAYQYPYWWSGHEDGSRGVYADFLDEASVILQRPALREVAALFRKAAALWVGLGTVLLPDDIPLLQETRDLLRRQFTLYLEQGNASLDERRQITARLDALRAAAQSWTLSEAGAAALRESIRAHVLAIHAAEQAAALALREVLG